MTDVTIIASTEDGEENEKGIDERLKEEQIQDQSRRARDFFSHMQSELNEIEGDLKDGLSYLDMKNDILLSYMIDLCNIVLRKVRGETISGHASVERCVIYRVILEKIKAIDQRLAYQLNKVISLPEGATEENQGINVDDLDIEVDSDADDEDDESENEEDGDSDQQEGSGVMSKLKGKKGKTTSNSDTSDEDDEDNEFDGSSNDDIDQEDENEEGEDNPELKERLIREKFLADRAKSRKRDRSKTSKTDIYKPPKLRSVAYEEFEGASSRERRRDYSEFYQEDDNVDTVDETQAHKDNYRTEYEEANYTRLPDDNPRKAKRKLKLKAMGGKGKKKFKSKGRSGKR